MGVWSDDTIKKGHRSRVTDGAQVLLLAAQGSITGPGGKKFGSIGVIVNCAVVQRLQ